MDKEQLEMGNIVQINQAVKYGCQHFNIYIYVCVCVCMCIYIYLDNTAKWQNK